MVNYPGILKKVKSSNDVPARGYTPHHLTNKGQNTKLHNTQASIKNCSVDLAVLSIKMINIIRYVNTNKVLNVLRIKFVIFSLNILNFYIYVYHFYANKYTIKLSGQVS